MIEPKACDARQGANHLDLSWTAIALPASPSQYTCSVAQFTSLPALASHLLLRTGAMSPTKDKAVVQKDQFKDYDEPAYFKPKSSKRSKLRTVFARIGLEKSDEQCKIYWDRLRTRNFQTAGSWYT